MDMMGEWVISLHQLFWLPLGHAGSRDAASHICTVAVQLPLCVLPNKCTNIESPGENWRFDWEF